MPLEEAVIDTKTEPEVADGDSQVIDNLWEPCDDDHDVARQFLEVEKNFPEDPPHHQISKSEETNNETQDPRIQSEGQFQCELCQCCFTRRTLLKIHSKTHTGEKPYKCQYCERGFIQKGNLQTHLMTHTGETPYVCDLCPCRFTTKCNLQRHLKSHTGEKPYECHICHHRFIQNENLQSHLRNYNKI